jgi:predicted Zn-dependent protease
MRTDSSFSITATVGEASGWAAGAHRSVDRLAVNERTRLAIHKARIGANPRELPAGRYTVILEPAAVGGLLNWMMWLLDAKSYYKGTSPFAGQLKKPIVDSRLNLHNMPFHPDLLGQRFNAEGIPSQEALWIKDGVLIQLAYDRFTAQQHGVDPVPLLDAPCFSGAGVDDLISTTERGLLVTNFWYLRLVNPTDLTLTGMTRDGTFLIEDGEIRTAVKNLRFHESPLRAFSQLDDCTHPAEAVTSETGKMLVPSMRITDFNFSSVTTF